jgi:hypothetical protein
MSEKRRSPRVRLEMECTLRRRSGSPIVGRTLDLGPGGMRIATPRPLSTDEVLTFELPPRISGRARVLRQQGYDSYAVRFETLADPAREALTALISA